MDWLGGIRGLQNPWAFCLPSDSLCKLLIEFHSVPSWTYSGIFAISYNNLHLNRAPYSLPPDSGSCHCSEQRQKKEKKRLSDQCYNVISGEVMWFLSRNCLKLYGRTIEFLMIPREAFPGNYITSLPTALPRSLFPAPSLLPVARSYMATLPLHNFLKFFFFF